MFNAVSFNAIIMGILAAFVGYAASFAIVLAGITATGATEQQAATGLFFATLGMGVCGVWLALRTRTPAAVAWSTPGAAFLASIAVLPGGFPEAVGAFIVCAILLLATGKLSGLAKLVSRIPKPVASALLAGVLLKLCLAPALAIGAMPLLFLPIFIAWLVGLLWHKLIAMPLAVLTLVIVLFYVIAGGDVASQVAPIANTANDAAFLPVLTPIVPIFSVSAVVSVAIPLYLITMAGQNIPGFTVLELNGYTVNRRSLLTTTGIGSLVIAPFGAVPVNMSAITAAMMAGEDAGDDKTKRYQAALICGLFYIALAFAAGVVTRFASQAPPGLIAGVAGLALLPALVASLKTAFSNNEQIEAPALTFLVTASGMTLMGVGGAFWGIVAGVAVWWLKQRRFASASSE